MSAAAASTGPEAGGAATLGPLRAWLVRHETALVWALVAVAAAVRVARWHVTAVMFNDGPVFLSLAEALGRLDLRTALGHPFHPLYPALVALVNLAVGDLETAAVAVSVVSGSLSVAVLHRLVRSGLSPAHGVVAAALLAVHPIAIEYTGDVQSEGLYLFFFLATAAAAVSALRRDAPGRAVGAGALAGAAYLTRPEGLGLVAVAAFVALLGVLRRRRTPGRAVALGLALALGVTVVASPYLVWLRVVEGSWAVTQKKNVSALVGLERAPVDGPPSGLPGPELPEQEPTAASSGPSAPAASPTDAAPAREPAPEPEAAPEAPETSWSARALRSLLDVGQTHVRAVHYGTLILLVLALAFGIAGRTVPPYAAFVTCAVAFHAVLLLGLAQGAGYVSGRHALPPMTLLLGHAAGGLLAAASAVRAVRPRVPAAVAAALLMLAFTGMGLGKALRPDRVDELAERRAAEWLRAHRVPVQAVAARKQRVAWYAQAPFVEIPLAAYPEGLRELGVSHLILADDDRVHYPRLQESLHAPSVEVLHRIQAGGRTASIYVLEPPG